MLVVDGGVFLFSNFSRLLILCHSNQSQTKILLKKHLNVLVLLLIYVNHSYRAYCIFSILKTYVNYFPKHYVPCHCLISLYHGLWCHLKLSFYEMFLLWSSLTYIDTIDACLLQFHTFTFLDNCNYINSIIWQSWQPRKVWMCKRKCALSSLDCMSPCSVCNCTTTKRR